MARKVFVTGDMAVDERLIEVAETNPKAALLWPWLLTVFDDWGRAEAQPKRIKATTFPLNDLVTPEDIEQAIQLYAKHGLVVTYEVEGKPYMAIRPEKWYKYQTHIRRERRPGKDKMESSYPAPPQWNDAAPAEPPITPAGTRGDSRGPVPSPPLPPSPSGGSGDGRACAREAKEPEPLLPSAFGQVYSACEEAFGYAPSGESIAAYLEDGFEPEMMTAVFRWVADRKRRGLVRRDGWSYAAGTLDRCRAAGIFTLAQWQSDQAQRLRVPDGQPRSRDQPDSVEQALAGLRRAVERRKAEQAEKAAMGGRSP